jgi:putative YhgA-like transposase
MPDQPADPTRASRSDLPELPLIREFDDRSTLWLLEDPQHLRGLLQILDPGLADRLDFAHARRINRSFIPSDLQKEESDLIYAVPFGDGSGRTVWVYVLLEHQSEPDPLMGLRLYLYMGQLWDTQRREWEDRKTPVSERRLLPVVPVVYYTGERRWSAPIDLKHLMDLPAELERFVPQWETLFLNLHQTPPESLTQFASAIGWALRVQQAESASLEEMEQALREAMAGLEGLTEEQSGQWLRVAWFLLQLISHRREEQSLLDLVLEEARQSKFRERERITTMGMTIAEQFEARGQLVACRENLRLLLEERFGPLPEALVQQIEGIEDIERLRTGLRQAVHLKSLAELKL